ncbi:MAG: hypothetical protein OIN85_07735 [Candidatus Methanoperedens sp.]|nr:hypothetical protein [Candidatus Methanoperedens sp.]
MRRLEERLMNKLSKKELDEIRQVKEESLGGECILWSELKKELKASPITIAIKKSKVDKLAGLLEDVDIDSVELQHRAKEVWTKN